MTTVEIDELELRRLCALPGARATSVAAALGVTVDTVRGRMARLGIPPFPRGRPPTARRAVDAENDHRQVLERVITSLRDLTPPQLTVSALVRAAELIDAHPEHRGLFVVAGETFGPHLTSRQNVGGIVAKAEEPCLVIDLDLLPPLRPAPERRAWPHTRGAAR